MRTRWMFLVFLISLTVGSCGFPQAGTEQAPELPPSGQSDPLQLNQTTEPAAMSPTLPVEKFVTLSKQDLASRLGIQADQINLVKSAEMLWLNSALGCPRPGVFYPSGRVPGFQIWLEVAGTEYIYNTDFNGTLTLCPELNPSVPNLPSDPTPGVPIR